LLAFGLSGWQAGLEASKRQNCISQSISGSEEETWKVHNQEIKTTT
jgi:hypothetical protein